MKQKTFKVEEFHRGRWQPLMIIKRNKAGDETEMQKTVRITGDDAQRMNANSMAYKERYILVEEVKSEPKDSGDDGLKQLQDDYLKITGEKPHHKWKIETLKAKIEEKQSE